MAGKRTVDRVTEKVMDKPDMTNVWSGSTIPRQKFCDAVIEVLCEKKKVIEEYLRIPDFSKVIDEITDLKTVYDMAVGAKCSIQCPVFKPAYTRPP